MHCAHQHTTMCSSTHSMCCTLVVFSCTHIANTFDNLHVNYNRNHCTHVDGLQHVCPRVLLDDTRCNVATRPSMFMHPRSCLTRYARRHAHTTTRCVIATCPMCPRTLCNSLQRNHLVLATTRLSAQHARRPCNTQQSMSFLQLTCQCLLTTRSATRAMLHSVQHVATPWCHEDVIMLGHMLQTN